jgi:hypothetical protein
MWWKGVVIWSVVLVTAYRAIPRLAPHRPKLARFAIGCSSFLVIDALYSWFSGRPTLTPLPLDQGLLLTALDVAAFVGMFLALVCGAIILFTDRR